MAQGGDRKSEGAKSSAQNEHMKPKGRTAERIAKEHNVGRNTVSRADSERSKGSARYTKRLEEHSVKFDGK